MSATRGYLAREQYAEIPPRVEYNLTDSGEELCQRMESILEWAEEEGGLSERSGH